MGKLGDVFGNDFEEKYENKQEEQRERRRKVETDTLKEICWTAVEGEGFDGEEPRFSFDAGEVEYDVLLMRSPDRDLQKFRHQLGDDAMSMGMFHLDTLFSCAFQGDMVSLIEKIEEDEYYIVVGNYQEKQSDGETYYNINPVAGIVPIAQARKYAEEADEVMQGSSIEEQAEKQTEEESSSSDEEDDLDMGDLDDEPDEASQEDILKVLKKVGEKNEGVMHSIASGDDDALEKVTQVVDNNVEGYVDSDIVAEAFHENVEPIDGYEDEEEEEEDDFDLGGLDGEEEEDENESEDTTEESSDTSSESSSDDSSDDEDDESDVEDWF